MENMNNTQNEEVVVVKKRKKKFSKITSLSLILATLLFCVGIVIVFNQYFLSYDTSNRMQAQINHDKKMVEKKPNDPGARVQLGYAFYLNGDNQEAIEQFNTAIKLDKNYYPAFLNLATVYDAQKKYNLALENATKAAKLNEKDARPLLIKGRAYYNLKLYQKAVNTLIEADKLSKANTDIVYELGKAIEAVGNKETALATYKEALLYNPTYKPALKAVERLEKKGK